MRNIYTLTAICCMLTIAVIIIGNMVSKSIKRAMVRSEEDLLHIINTTVIREFDYKKYFEFQLKQVVLINDYEKELTELVERTMNAFSTDFLEELQFYYTLNYITKHVTKSHQILLTNYIDEKKITTR